MFASMAPFKAEGDFGPELAALVTAGRRKEFARFPQFSDPQARERIPDPNDPATYAGAVLDWSHLQAPGHQASLALHRALLAPRRPRFVPASHPAMHPGRCARVELDGRAVGHVGELHPRWRQAYELPSAPHR